LLSWSTLVDKLNRTPPQRSPSPLQRGVLNEGKKMSINIIPNQRAAANLPTDYAKKYRDSLKHPAQVGIGYGVIIGFVAWGIIFAIAEQLTWI